MTDKSPELDHQTHIQDFEQAFDASADERALAERDRDYYDNKQLTDGELETLRKRGQPPVISNRIAPKIDALLGHEKRMRTDPRAYPRTPQHEQDAESATDAIRFVCDDSRFSQVRSNAAENLLIEGIGAATVTVQMRDDRADVKITHVPWDRFYRDPHSRRRDFKDARFMGVVVWMDEDEALAQFEGKEEVVSGCYSDTEGAGDTFGDRPATGWADRKNRRIRVLQHRFKAKGVWHTAIVCRGGYLRDPQPSPYVDEDGVPQCDLIATSAYVDRDNKRYGVARRMISPQDEINKRRSKALHLLNSRLVISEKGAVEDREQARREVARPDGYVEVNPGMRFDLPDNQSLAMGQFNLLQEAKSEIDASGVNPALEGDASAPSGRAQEMMMQSGLAEMAGVYEAIRDWSWEVYRQVWYRIRQYWTDERWIRVTDDERNLKWVALNKPVTQFDQILQEAEQSGQQIPPEMLAQMQADPRLQQVVDTQNQISELDVDLILEDGPDSITIQSEQYAELIKLKTADPSSIPTRAIIEASSLRNKDQLLEHLDQGGIPPEVQQQMQQMEQALQEAQGKLQEAEQKARQAGSDTQLQEREMRIKEYEAVTDRIKALKAIPPDIPDGWQGDASTPQVPDQTPPPSGVFVG